MSDSKECIRVALVGPQITCWGLQQLVQSSPRFSLVGSAPSLSTCMQGAWPAAADVVVVDFDDSEELPTLLDFLGVCAARLVLLTAMTEVAALDGAVLKGLQGIVRKSEPPGVLLKAIEKVHQGELWIDRGSTSRIFVEMLRQKAARNDDPELARIATLTQRERQAIAALASDTSAPGKVIASRLCISEHTLRNHLSSIYSKLEVSNRVDLYAFATRHHLDKPQLRAT
ncbi:helix-turn-helix transcriptional regulator [Ramlibacter rhizophilus]|uniref:Response regulator transcription factor n=1 Tax=Ramlibacter rhizophilus TaxID=1781167 RepID=A0A4Z0BDY1_9BURK|nr:response regulator transcription factor [Ramlibacter rhizophilus]TFY96891.1 response regulator transcription factor [Ramlibacter rhizophilus]